MAVLATLTDNFNNNSLSSSWDAASLSADSNQIAQYGGQVSIAHTASSQYNTLVSASTYDLTDSYAHVKMLNFGDQSLVSHEAQLQIYLDGNNKMWITATNNTLLCYKLVASVQTQVGSTKPLNLHDHRWFRIREASGTIYYETSYNGIDWITQETLVNPFSVTAIKVALISGCWASEATATGASFDDFNIIQLAGTEFSTYRHIEVGDGMSRSDSAT